MKKKTLFATPFLLLAASCQASRADLDEALLGIAAQARAAEDALVDASGRQQVLEDEIAVTLNASSTRSVSAAIVEWLNLSTNVERADGAEVEFTFKLSMLPSAKEIRQAIRDLPRKDE
ncbi:MAG: hypothetical protein AAF682_22010 [Planctomycetota bacterium]